MTRQKPARFQHYFFMGGGGVFVVVSVFKNFILKLDIATSIFLDIFVQDCRINNGFV